MGARYAFVAQMQHSLVREHPNTPDSSSQCEIEKNFWEKNLPFWEKFIPKWEIFLPHFFSYHHAKDRMSPILGEGYYAK